MRRTRFWASRSAAVTMVKGGVRSNVIPDACELTVDARTIHAFDNERDGRGDPRGRILGGGGPLGAAANPSRDDPEWTIAKAALQAAPGSSVVGFQSVSDLAHLGGKPAIVFGPGTPDQSHKADESISLSKLAEAPEIYRRTIAAWFRLEGAL